MYGGPIIRNTTCCYLPCLKEVSVKGTLHALSGVAKENTCTEDHMQQYTEVNTESTKAQPEG